MKGGELESRKQEKTACRKNEGAHRKFRMHSTKEERFKCSEKLLKVLRAIMKHSSAKGEFEFIGEDKDRQLASLLKVIRKKPKSGTGDHATGGRGRKVIGRRQTRPERLTGATSGQCETERCPRRAGGRTRPLQRSHLRLAEARWHHYRQSGHIHAGIKTQVRPKSSDAYPVIVRCNCTWVWSGTVRTIQSHRPQQCAAVKVTVGGFRTSGFRRVKGEVCMVCPGRMQRSVCECGRKRRSSRRPDFP